ncbi:MAG TPA: ATP-binding protein, partial [Xanthobacteraceae bacterium]
GIIADKRALLQIMLNLLSNAVKFTDRGGKVTVTAAAEAGQDAGREAGREKGDNREPAHLVVTVEDTGVGIGAEDLPRVGEPFFQARSSYDRRHDGTGLGLSIVKGLLSLHGGWMEIESRVGEGTRAIVHLPFDCEAARRKREAHARVLPLMGEARVGEARADARLETRTDIEVKKSA